MKRPVIIDTDPGIDDAVAFFLAFAAEELDIKGITAVAGNQTLDKTGTNALKLVDFAGQKIPVARGSETPILRKLVTAEFVHGATGLGTLVLPEPTSSFSEKNACDMIYETAVACDGKLLLVALGPLTNIALTLLKYPDVKDKIDELILMGGSMGLGNDTPAAEFNLMADPEAAKIVFGSGLKITMVGLDVTHRAVLTEEEINELTSGKSKISGAVRTLLNDTLTMCRGFGHKDAVIHDPFAMAYAIDPLVMKTENYHVDIETRGKFTSGKTVVDIYGVTGEPENVQVGVEVDRERFVALVRKLINRYEN